MITLSIPRKALFSFATAALILAVIGGESYRGLRASAEASVRVRRTYDAIQMLGVLEGDVLDAESAVRGLLLTDRPAFRGPYDDAAQRVRGDLAGLRRFEPDDPAQGARADILADSVGQKMALMGRVLALYDSSRAAVGRDTVADDASVLLSTSIRQQISRMTRAERALLDRRLREERAEEQLATTVLLFGFIVACAVAALAVITIGRDIRERERLDAELVQALEQAHAASAAKSEFLARMSHELRTPLNSVIGFSNVLLKPGPGAIDETARSYVERIRANGTHLLEIINDILDLSKVESGRMDVVLQTIDVARLLDETVAQFSPRGTESPLVEVERPDEIEPLRTDPDKLRQVLLNLIANAVKFTQGGRVVVRAITDHPAGALQRLDVIDNGVGIAPDRVGRIFEAFEQADSSVQRRFGGTGLGLAIARSMCERLGYRLGVVSEEEVGSTFSIYVTPGAPVVARHVAPGPSRGAGPGAGGGRGIRQPVPRRLTPSTHADAPLVLIIDDSEDSRVLLSQIAEESGSRVLTAASGEAGISTALDRRPDLIVLDLLMPEMDGSDTLQRLKAHPSIAQTPVIVVSVVASEYQGRLAGAVDVFNKPIARDTLAEAIDRALNARPARVLVVEDSDDSHRLIEAHLAGFPGLEVESAPTAVDALAKLQSFHADLILLDVVLPGVDGLEFLRRIRRTERYRETPVVVITAKSLSDAEQKVLQRDTVTVLAKGPALGGDLARVLRGVLRQIRARRAD
ncbi:MAG TPA: response regulator [Gemmatimonadaceae bacterium]|nr:response regulator [Gemmatimonadaceae bacterium]